MGMYWLLKAANLKNKPKFSKVLIKAFGMVWWSENKNKNKT